MPSLPLAFGLRLAGVLHMPLFILPSRHLTVYKFEKVEIGGSAMKSVEPLDPCLCYPVSQQNIHRSMLSTMANLVYRFLRRAVNGFQESNVSYSVAHLFTQKSSRSFLCRPSKVLSRRKRRRTVSMVNKTRDRIILPRAILRATRMMNRILVQVNSLTNIFPRTVITNLSVPFSIVFFLN
jgi:hypothetical protein